MYRRSRSISMDQRPEETEFLPTVCLPLQFALKNFLKSGCSTFDFDLAEIWIPSEVIRDEFKAKWYAFFFEALPQSYFF